MQVTGHRTNEQGEGKEQDSLREGENIAGDGDNELRDDK